MSGDETAFILCTYFRPVRCIFVTSVPGVLDKTNKVIRHIEVPKEGSPEMPADMAASVSGKSPVDVTGGMKKKVETAQRIVQACSPSCSVVIVQCGSTSAAAAMKGEDPSTATIVSCS